MTLPNLEERIAILEREFEAFKLRLNPAGTATSWRETFGMFARDPDFEEVLRLGREFREEENRKATP